MAFHRLTFMYVSVLVSFCWRVFSSSFPYFLFILLFFNDFDLFPRRFLDIYFLKPSEFNDVSKKVERPNQTKPNRHIMADEFGISELVTLAAAQGLKKHRRTGQENGGGGKATFLPDATIFLSS